MATRHHDFLIVLIAIAALCRPAVAQAPDVDPRLPRYEPLDTPVAGRLWSLGSDYLNNLMTLWGGVLIKQHDGLQIKIIGKGGTTAPFGLLHDQCDVGAMSRPLREKERAMIAEKWGSEPRELVVARNIVAVYVHEDNPIAKRGLTLDELDAIYSSTRKRGHATDVTTWGDVGLEGEWADRPIVLVGRNSASGLHGLFKARVLLGGDFKLGARDQPGSSAVVRGVVGNRYGIGYAPIGYRINGIVPVPLKVDADSDPIAPTPDNFDAWPITQSLMLVTRLSDDHPVSPPVRELFCLIFSREGQQIVIRDGYVPLPADVAKDQAAKVGIDLKLVEVKQDAAVDHEGAKNTKEEKAVD